MLVRSENELRELLATPAEDFIAVKKSRLADLPVEAAQCLEHRAESARYTLFVKRAYPCNGSRSRNPDATRVTR